MLDVGWTELLVIGVVALLVIGPRDLPEMFRQLGRVTAKLRSMAREFQRAMDEAAKQAGVADVAKDLRHATSPKAMGMDAVKSAADKFEKWDPLKNKAQPSSPLPAPTSTRGATLTPPPMPAMTATTPAGGQPEVGSATQALYDKQAAKAAAYREYSAQLKRIEEGDATALAAAAKGTTDKAAPKAGPKSGTKAAAKPRAAKAAPAADAPVGVATPAAQPGTTRRSPAKKKADPA